MKPLRSILLACLLFLPLFSNTVLADLVSMRNKGSHWRIVLDYSGGISCYEMGVAYGRTLTENIPGLAARIDRYLAENLTQAYAELCISRFSSLDVPEDYIQELNGISDGMRLAGETRIGDGRLSRVEFFLRNYLADVTRATECSGLAVWGEQTPDGSVLVGRNLDMPTKGRALLSAGNAVVVIKNGERSHCRIGYLGFMPVLTAFRPNGLFVAAIDAGLTRPRALPDDPPNPIIVASRYRQERSSWVYALRHAVEHYDTIEAAAGYLTSLRYHRNHNVLIADRSRAVVVENNVSGPEGEGDQLIRDVSTPLNYGVEPWDPADSIGVVNSFIASGNYDNHTTALRNVRRRHNQLRLLRQKAADETVSLRDLIDIQSWYRGETPGSIFDGSIFNYDWRVYTAQSMVFSPKGLTLRVFFDTGTPEGGLPEQPVYRDVTVGF
jgi:hypothetical protein